MNSLGDLAGFYSRHGVTRKAFLTAANSAETTRQMKSDFKLVRDWGVMGTPTIVVNGKYRSNRIHNYKELVNLTRWLVQRELGKKPDQAN